MHDSGAPAAEVRGLGFGRSRFRFAGPQTGPRTPAELDGRRIATSYPRLLQEFLTTHSIDARIVKLDGAVESSISLGVADAIADVVETGTTLRKAGLSLFGETILESEAVVIQRQGFTGGTIFEHFLQRINGVQVAREYVMLDYDVPEDALDRVIELTPGLESPTISPLSRTGGTPCAPWWVADSCSHSWTTCGMPVPVRSSPRSSRPADCERFRSRDP